MDKGNYFTVETWMIHDLKLKPSELIIYAIIHGFCQDGQSYFYGSVDYIMRQTNLSKETVLTILQKLVAAGHLIKRDVKTVTVFDKAKTARGNQHFCLYYTAVSRQKHDPDNNTSSGQETRPEEKVGSRNLTGTGQEIRPAAGQETRPNTTTDKTNNTSTSGCKTEAAEDIIISKIKKLFGSHYPFDSDFAGKIALLFGDFKITEQEVMSKYLDYVYERTHARKPVSITNMFYKLAQSSNIIQDFIITSGQVVKAEAYITCPVCGYDKANNYTTCPQCGFDMYLISDDKEVKLAKQIFNLPEKERNALQIELNDFFTTFQKSYGSLLSIKDMTVRTEFDRSLNKIYQKYRIDA
ncbi:helix-turn-helix domain-containing protein [Treponema sp. Marseille-Q4523]|uniref:helix-turn-helix domain-containing protein n=1 Tax=Treponema sp. Marseille-Q4523 TaxID=2810610 RepID=UPI0019617654|nr:helix-turn-helix domain-containing protein [Treponema sp. Marseille-Q4523]MBM7022661.1 helix-turn-helix domain-containing protein [Treponema sp. Marseille-Q4523]